MKTAVRTFGASSNEPASARQAAEGATEGRVSLETLVPILVKRLAWSAGDGRRTAMRFDISEGYLAGVAVLVQTEGGRVQVQLDAPSHVDAPAWGLLIVELLAQRGVLVDGIALGGR